MPGHDGSPRRVPRPHQQRIDRPRAANWNSDRMVLSMYGAHEVDARTAPELVNMVAAIAARAGLPMPRVFLMDNPQPNAFATGRNPQNAAVAVTTGLVQSLSREELSGVIDCTRPVVTATAAFCGL